MGRLKTGLAAVVVTGVGAIAALAVWPVGQDPADIDLTGDTQRGAYLARAGGCIACHTNVEEGGAPLAGGAPLKTPFGTFYPPNLTSDPDHGIGGWTATDFARAIRQGVSPDGAPYYPTFTYPFYADLTDQDIADLWAAFQTVAPVAEDAPAHDVGFPFNQRWGLKVWRAAFLTDPQTEPVAGKGEDWNRGRELVRGVTHCGACHTTRNALGARIRDAMFSGNDELPGGHKAPSILPDELRAKDWTVQNLAYALQSGVTPSGDVFGGSMGEVVQGGTRFMTQADRQAMATYLMDSDVSSDDDMAAVTRSATK